MTLVQAWEGRLTQQRSLGHLNVTSCPPSQGDTSPDAPEHCLPDIFLLILLCDGDVPAVGFQFVLKNPPESVVLHTERVIEHGGDVVLSGGEHRGGSQGGPASSLARGG